MKATVNKDSKCLIANSDHKNFTETNEVIEEGSILNGDIKNVEGLRRGEPFTYRLFITKEGKILYLNNVTPMKTVEVTMRVLIEVDDTIVDVDNIDSDLVVCFYKDDGYGNEMFLPKADGLTVLEYLDTRIESINEVE
jgi:hypothetical protein